MYVKPPNQNRSKVKLPENYGGSAFSPSGLYNDMPPPTRQSAPRSALPPSPTAYSDASSGVYRRSYDQGHEEMETVESREVETESADVAVDVDRPSDRSSGKSERVAGSIFSALMPESNFSKNFPFGHGVGSEELLILGIMLLVYLSGAECGKTDNEFLLLLGLLLFAG